MFPLSGRLDAASKSNSSTLEPSRMTTLVSSGWLASISIRLVMEISGARAGLTGGTACGGSERTARIVDGKQWREPVRRNGRWAQGALCRNSVGWERKSDRHCYVWAMRPKELPEEPFGPACARDMPGFVRGGGVSRDSRAP